MINFLKVRQFSGGNTLLVIIGVDYLEKKSLKFRFFTTIRNKRIIYKKGDILSALHLLITLLIIFQ